MTVRALASVGRKLEEVDTPALVLDLDVALRPITARSGAMARSSYYGRASGEDVTISAPGLGMRPA